MNTIQAQVNQRLLTKADRLFTGSCEGRVIEILQNARRAGATNVEITNKNGMVTVHDNGRGIQDWTRLLDMGGQGWDDKTEAGEDPAGVGIFCLAPRRLTITSNGYKAVIEGDGWTGDIITVTNDPSDIKGTLLEFEDDSGWDNHYSISKIAAFTGLVVTVDGHGCWKEDFLDRSKASHYQKLGVYIRAVPRRELSYMHRSYDLWNEDCFLINFYGQVIVDYATFLGGSGFAMLVEMSGEPTYIRTMLPARTQLVRDEARTQLLEAIEHEMYLAIQRSGEHKLPYKKYCRGIELLGPNSIPEAVPCFDTGLLPASDNLEPPEIHRPDGFTIDKCYRLSKSASRDDRRNAHLLAALGSFEAGTFPFVPVSFNTKFEGYSWTKLPYVTSIKVESGRFVFEGGQILDGDIDCVESLKITIETEDGKTFSSPVCIASIPVKGGGLTYEECNVLVTREAEGRNHDLWYLLGGYNMDGDSWESQEQYISSELAAFWADVAGPNEQFRRKMFEVIRGFRGSKWSTAKLDFDDGTLEIKHGDKTEMIHPPEHSK